MPRDDDQSLGGEQTFSGKVERDDSPESIGEEGTYAGGPRVRDTQSLGDQSTFGDAGGDDEPFDDGMEVVDLSARYTTEGVLGKGGMGEVLLAMDTTRVESVRNAARARSNINSISGVPAKSDSGWPRVAVPISIASMRRMQVV